MSVEQVKAFFAKVKEDSTLAKKIKDAQAAYNGDTSDKVAAFAEIVIPVAKSAGFNFTVDDFKATFDNNGEGEASGDELDAVAGGNFYCMTGNVNPYDNPNKNTCQPFFDFNPFDH